MSDDDVTEPAELQLLGRSADGSQIELSGSDGRKYTLQITEPLKTSIAGKSTAPQTHLTSVAPTDDRPTFGVKEIQARLRAGESIGSITRTTGWSSEKIEKFSGPIIQERAYVIATALKSGLRRDSNSPTLEDATFMQLSTHGVDMEQVEWNTHRNLDGNWNITVHYPNIDGTAQANWDFELENRILTTKNDSARWIAGEGRETRTKPSTHGFINSAEATPLTPFTPYPSSSSQPPRLVAVREEEIEEEFFADEFDIQIADESDPVEDGVVKRPKLPSWDDIMFGGSKTEDD